MMLISFDTLFNEIQALGWWEPDCRSTLGPRRFRRVARVGVIAAAALAPGHGAAAAWSPDTPDLPQLAVAIVEAVREQAGLAPDAPYPAASGPFVVDDRSFVDACGMLGDSVGLEVRDTLLARGYAFGDFDSLLRGGVDSLGVGDYWLADDAIYVRMLGLNASGVAVSAIVQYAFTWGARTAEYGRWVCPVTLEIGFDYVEGRWQAREPQVVMQC